MEYIKDELLSDEEILSDEELDFHILYDDINFQIKNIWYNVILPYVESNDSILNLNDEDLYKFALFFYQNSKYYKFVLNNLD
jgi:hypothetical protein